MMGSKAATAATALPGRRAAQAGLVGPVAMGETGLLLVVLLVPMAVLAAMVAKAVTGPPEAAASAAPSAVQAQPDLS